MYVVTPGQQKGGVGKTTVTANLAAVSGEAGLKVLIVDLDPQSHLTLSLNQETVPGLSVGDLLNSQVANPPSFDDVVLSEVLPGVDLLPGDERALEMAEKDIATDPLHGLARLRKLLSSVDDRYQICYIDTPPKIEGLAVVAMVASDGVVIVSEAQSLSFASTTVYAGKVAQVAGSSLNPNLRILGVLLNKVVPGEEADMVIASLKDAGLHVFENAIPSSRRASKAAAFGVPAALANRNHSIGTIYRMVADELVDRLTEMMDGVES